MLIDSSVRLNKIGLREIECDARLKLPSTVRWDLPKQFLSNERWHPTCYSLRLKRVVLAFDAIVGSN